MGKATWLNVGGTWRQVIAVWGNSGGTWNSGIIPWIKIDDPDSFGTQIWKDCITYALPFNINWSFSKDSSFAGDLYLKITVNGSSVVYIADLSGSGTLNLNNGDTVEVEVSMNGNFIYGTTDVTISGSGVYYDVPNTGWNQSSYQAFTYYTSNGLVYINGSINP